MGLDLETLSREDSPAGLADDFLIVHHKQFAVVGHGLFLHVEEWRWFGSAGLSRGDTLYGSNCIATTVPNHSPINTAISDYLNSLA